MAEVAALLSEAAGAPVAFVNETMDEAYASRAHHEATAFEVAGWVTSYSAIAAGELAVVSDVVERIAGHEPTSLRAFLQARA